VLHRRHDEFDIRTASLLEFSFDKGYHM